MTPKKDIQSQLNKILNTGKYHATQMAEELRTSAHKVREGFDEKKLRKEQNELFRKLGEQAYNFYKEGKEHVPNILNETIDKIDEIAGDVIPKDKIENIGDIVEQTFRNVVEDVNDFFEDTIKKRHQSDDDKTTEANSDSDPNKE